ncbi:MAG: SMC-Scp complex subunit ScpB [Firmicutes bacterium]|nr:SMC-Scp complex subunit ScpB [Bacillota bacterium]
MSQEIQENQNQKKNEPPVHEAQETVQVPQDKLEQVAEALLFSAGDSVALVHIAKTLGLDQRSAQEVIEQLAAKYDADMRGIRILRVGNSYQMSSRPDYYPFIGQLFKAAAASINMTDTQMETLAIIAYRQPVTKMEIEEIRGVRSDAIVNRLVEYGLIEEKGRLKAPGRPIQFGTTEEFLKFFGLESLEQMPHLKEAAADAVEHGVGQMDLADLEILEESEEG